jgi:hypothetical protein
MLLQGSCLRTPAGCNVTMHNRCSLRLELRTDPHPRSHADTACAAVYCANRLLSCRTCGQTSAKQQHNARWSFAAGSECAAHTGVASSWSAGPPAAALFAHQCRCPSQHLETACIWDSCMLLHRQPHISVQGATVPTHIRKVHVTMTDMLSCAVLQGGGGCVAPYRGCHLQAPSHGRDRHPHTHHDR